ncbi:serine/threonine-protein kinase [Sorangium sp. So ce394]|uniref:serine/threonine-protein kinase n=1 Tax=Sorangium sp. So ce394 TaxID=3133310 RepID=UPI003F5C85DE
MTSKSASFLGTGRFELRAHLGHGGMGTVYRVHDRELGQDVALKMMRQPGPEQVLRLKSEFRALAGVTHPNLLQLHELFVDDERCFFTMELVEGKDLLRWIRDDLGIPGASVQAPTAERATATMTLTPATPAPGGDTTASAAGKTPPLAPRASSSAPGAAGAPPASGALDEARGAQGPVPEQAWARLRQGLAGLVRGLHALHASGRVHRDVKPANVLVSAGDRITLLDFGLVTAFRGASERPPDEIAGTPAYMAPEQVRRGAITRAADLYAVGVILYEALTGVLPFRGTMDMILYQKVQYAPKPALALAPDAPEDLLELAMALLALDPDRRPGAEACLAVLAPGQGGAAAAGAAEAAPGPPFVGRAAEMAAIARALDEVAGARRQITVHVHGPSGIGKSTLVRELLEAQRRAGDLLVLQGRCHPAESLPYKALDAAIDGLAAHLETLSAEALSALVPAGARALTQLFPVLAQFPALLSGPEPAAQPDPIALQQQGAAALRDLMGRLAATRLVVLWLDDVQWGDVDSAPLLDELTRAPAPPLLLLLTYRSDERQRSPLLRHLLEGADGGGGAARTIELGALGVDDVAALARAMLGADGARRAGQIDAVVAQAEGNPFIAAEMARYLGARAAEGGAGDERAPLDVAALVMARVRALDPGPQRLLEIAAVAGKPLERGVALAAAGLDERQRPLVARLRDANLLREIAGDGASGVAIYHDRIREALLAALPAEQRAGRHRAIAEALEAQGARDHEALAYHWEGAGEPRRAGEHALRAADRAAAALAFEHAAVLYEKGLALSGDAAGRAGILEKLGDALVNLGRAPEAAERYLEAAAHVGGPPAAERALALRRRAAEQHLKAGFIDAGWREMRSTLEALRVPIPGSFAGALAAASWRRLAFLLGRSDARRRAFPAALPAAERPRLDALWTASTSMSMLSPHLADAFRMLHLRRVLKVGDASTVCRALAYEASMETHLGGALLDRSVEALLEQVSALAVRTGDPYDAAWRELALVNVAFTRGEWRRTAEACRRADTLFRERCPGTAWERVTVAIFHHFALAWLGELRELLPRLSELAGDARRRGDVHALCEAHVGEPMLAWLAADRGDEAQASAAAALGRQASRSRRWPEHGYRRQEYAAMIASGYAALYRGDPWAAWAAVLDHWPRLEASFLLPLRGTGLELRWTRARAALAAAATRPRARRAGWTERALLDDARAQIRRIERDPLAAGAPIGQLLRAGIARVEGRAGEAARALEAAIAGFDRLEMALHREAARLALGQLAGGSAGAAQIRRVEAWMAAQGVARPRALAAAVAPGLDLSPEGRTHAAATHRSAP